MRAGRLDRKIVIERAGSSTEDALGNPITSWTTLQTTWAEYIPVPGKEVLAADRITGIRTARFIVRWLSDINEKDRIVFEGENWNIVHFREIGRRDGLEILAEVLR